MRKGLGIVCLLLGVLCLLSAVGLLVYNLREAAVAAKVSGAMLERVQSAIRENKTSQKNQAPKDEATAIGTEKKEMATVQVEGDECIGILSIPNLGLELPVLTDWSYAKLKKAPCLYYGSYYEKDFVIAAHNYQGHFGRLSELREGDPIRFTDVNGGVYSYKVVLTETLPKEATEEMIASGFDLSLYTCTLGGGNRVTVRCEKAE